MKGNTTEVTFAPLLEIYQLILITEIIEGFWIVLQFYGQKNLDKNGW